MVGKNPPLPPEQPCHYCGVVTANTWDHVVPLGRGGYNRTWNRVPACKECNHAKGHHWPTCECDFCREAVRLHYAERKMRVGEVYEFGPPAETKPGLPIETVEQLQAWLDSRQEEGAP